MSQTAKIIIGIVVIVLIGGGMYYYFGQPAAHEARETGKYMASTTLTDSTDLPSGSDTSDASLDQDLNAINAQVQASGNEAANVGASVNTTTP